MKRARARPRLLLASRPRLRPAAAKDSLGVFSDWGAFRDPSVPRCYAIAMPEADNARARIPALRQHRHLAQAPAEEPAPYPPVAADEPGGLDHPADREPGIRADRRRRRCPGEGPHDGCRDRRGDALGRGDDRPRRAAATAAPSPTATLWPARRPRWTRRPWAARSSTASRTQSGPGLLPARRAHALLFRRRRIRSARRRRRRPDGGRHRHRSGRCRARSGLRPRPAGSSSSDIRPSSEEIVGDARTRHRHRRASRRDRGRSRCRSVLSVARML